MTHDETHPDLDRLGDYLDGVLAVDRKLETDAHLADCAACRARLGSLRLLVARAGDAPRELSPAADLWPRIRERIEERRVAVLPVGAPPAPPPPAAPRDVGAGRAPAEPAHGRRTLVAAAVLVAVAAGSSAVTARLLRGPSPAPARVARATPAAAGDALVRYAALEPDYDRSARELWAAVWAARATLAPQTVATVQRSVATIDRAIAEARAALERDPGNAALVEMLTSSQEQKLDLLRRAAYTSAGS